MLLIKELLYIWLFVVVLYKIFNRRGLVIWGKIYKKIEKGVK